MSKLQKFGKIIVLFLVVTGLASCEDDEPNITFNVIGDVFITKRLINNDVNFALVYFAYGNQSMSSATVAPEGDEEMQLEPLDAPQRTYGIQPTIDDFSPDLPEFGTFNFKVINEGIEHTASDILLFDNLKIPVITSAEFNSISETIMVEWETVTDAQSYTIKLAKENGDVIFVGQLLNDLVTAYEVDTDLGSWFEVPQYGTTYKVEVHAYLYDADAGYSDYMYHIQENSIGEMEVTWGE